MTRDILISIKGLYSVRDEETPPRESSAAGRTAHAENAARLGGAAEGNSDDSVEVFSPGKYYFRNGKHYVEYEEPEDGDMTDGTSGTAGASGGDIKTRITLRGRRLEVIRKGIVNTKMVFEEGVKNTCWYDTVAGSLLMGIDVKKMQITESEELIEILVDYALEANYEHLTDNSIRIRIMAKDSGLFHLV
ncbi:MAG: DUF1934 domain-containing protein [Lachnospiraceae bacterium]|nr:DUF1934 domain-containing protein [Lachnospiraceae bacterium]